MRYMWICNRALSPQYVGKCLASTMHGYMPSHVLRRMTFTKRVCWVFLSSWQTYEWASNQKLTDYDGDYWSITSCNKQYVSNAFTGKYIGALGEVDLQEAQQWVNEDKSNWYLTDVETDRVWMPLQRNPNKLIPTGDAGYCRHCGNTSAQTPGNRYRPLYRPWPLHVDA